MNKFYFIPIILVIIIFKSNLIANEIKDEIFKSVGARAAGMGGAFTSVVNDYSSFFWNPAGLVNINKTNTSAFFDSIFRGKQNIYGINYSQPLFADMSTSITYLKTLFNESNFINDFFYFSFASFLHEKKETAFGINFKLLNFLMRNYDFYGFTTAFDVGFLFFPNLLDNKLRFSLVAKDLDAKIKWSNNINEKIPVTYKAGTCYMFDNTSTIAIDITMTNFEQNNKKLRLGLSLGGEKYFLNDTIGNVGFRAGLFYMEKINMSFGISYERKEFALNYVFIPGLNELGQTHKLDFTYFIGEDIRGKEYKKEIIPEIKENNIAKLKQTLKSMELELSQRYISPNNDEIYDTIEIRLKNSPEKITNCNWKIIITDKDENVIKEISGLNDFQPKIVWDGKDQKGKIVKDGEYTIKYSIIIGDEVVWEKNKIVTIDTKPPIFKLNIFPKIFAPIESSKFKKMQINIDSKDKDINLWSINILNEKNNIIRKISGESITDKIYWSGDDALGNVISDGKYKIKFIAHDFAGNTFEQTEDIIVDTYVANFNMFPDKRLFDVVKDNIIITSNKKDLKKIKKIDIGIYDYNKNLLKLFKNINISNDEIIWDGKNEKNQYIKKGSPYLIKASIEQINGIEIEKEYIIQTKPEEFEGVGIQLILAVINFKNKSFDIPNSEYENLDQVIEAVNKYAKNYFLILKGYATDYESSEKNLELSINRVHTIYTYLTSIKKLNPANIFMIGYGDGNIIEGISKDTILKFGTKVEVELLTK